MKDRGLRTNQNNPKLSIHTPGLTAKKTFKKTRNQWYSKNKFHKR